VSSVPTVVVLRAVHALARPAAFVRVPGQFLLLRGFLNSFYVQFLDLVLVGWPRVTAAAAKLPQITNSIDVWRSFQPELNGT